MADSTFWWLAAGGLVAFELVTGTFYLLMIAVGLMAAALCAHAGFASTAQWVVAAMVAGGSVVAWRRYKTTQPPVASASTNHDVNMDIGESVNVLSWNSDGTCAVKYRGAQWSATLVPGEVAQSGTHAIVEVTGSRLILKKQ